MLDAFLQWYAPAKLSAEQRDQYFSKQDNSGLPHGDIASVFLAAGDLDRGWLFYEDAVRSLVRRRCPVLPHPFWAGEDFKDRKIIFRRERSPGDEICYSGVFNDLINYGCRVVVEADTRLVSLFERSFPRAEIVPRIDPPDPRALSADIDFQASYTDSYRLLRSRVDKFPRHAGYIKPLPERVEHWRQETTRIAQGRLRVGLGWRGSQRGNQTWFLPDILDWESVLRVEGTEIFSLQYDDCAEEIAAAHQRFGRRIHVMDGLDLFNDMENLAAFIASLDLVIGVSTVNIHMAGAVNTPTFEIGPRYWHLFLGADADPFYPSVRAFIAPCGAPLRTAIDQAAGALDQLICGRN